MERLKKLKRWGIYRETLEDVNPLNNLKSIYAKGYRYMSHDGTVYRPQELDAKARRAYNCIHAGENIDPDFREYFVEQNRKEYIDIGCLITLIEKCRIV